MWACFWRRSPNGEEFGAGIFGAVFVGANGSGARAGEAGEAFAAEENGIGIVDDGGGLTEGEIFGVSVM